MVFAAGYVLAVRGRFSLGRMERAELESPERIASSLTFATTSFVALLVIAIFSVIRTGALSDLSTWWTTGHG